MEVWFCPVPPSPVVALLRLCHTGFSSYLSQLCRTDTCDPRARLGIGAGPWAERAEQGAGVLVRCGEHRGRGREGRGAWE